MSTRAIALTVGGLFIPGDVAGVSSALLTHSVHAAKDPLTVVAAHPRQVELAALLILTMGVTLALIPVVIFPVLRRQSEILALGYLVFRGALETVTYIAASICLLLLVPLAQEYVRPGSPSVASARSSGAFLLDAQDTIADLTSIIFSLGALMLYWVLWKAKLVPRWLSGWGLVGAVLYLASGVGAVFGAGLGFLMVPLAVQELALAVWLITKGFDEHAVGAGLLGGEADRVATVGDGRGRLIGTASGA